LSRYTLSPAAERDLEEIEAYIAEDDPRAAARMIDAIEAACELIAGFPEIGRLREELAPAVRSFGVASYLVFYRASGDDVAVARVLHGSRDLPAAFRGEG
jgi:toxin ParE1/3/4